MSTSLNTWMTKQKRGAGRLDRGGGGRGGGGGRKASRWKGRYGMGLLAMKVKVPSQPRLRRARLRRLAPHATTLLDTWLTEHKGVWWW